MKFLHLADIHLGASPDLPNGLAEKRKKEIWNSFRNVIETCEREKIDLLLIVGDLFHRQPLLRELKEVSYLFGKLTKTQVVLVAGLITGLVIGIVSAEMLKRFKNIQF